MATKRKKTAAMQPVDKLTGTIRGEHFTVVLDDISIGDKWSANVLPKLQKDGVGYTILKDGATSFEFKDSFKSTIKFRAASGNLEVTGFEIFTEVSEDEDLETEEEVQE